MTAHDSRRTAFVCLLAFALLALGLPAFAATTGGGGTGGGGTGGGSAGAALTINTMLDNISKWLSGPLAVSLGTIALVAAAFVWMFLRHERGADFAFRALLGTAIAIGAANLITTFVGSGAAL